jgi:signal peptidase II
MRKKLFFIGIIVLCIFFLDHLTKWLIVTYLPQGTEISVMENIFDIVHTRNKGAAFGLLHNWESPYRNSLFYGVGILAFFFIFYYIKTTPYRDKITLFSLALITGGALGNIIDRFFRGSVVDFLHFHYYDRILNFSVLNREFLILLSWPAFNVADSAISVGICLLILRSFFKSSIF